MSSVLFFVVCFSLSANSLAFSSPLLMRVYEDEERLIVTEDEVRSKGRDDVGVWCLVFGVWCLVFGVFCFVLCRLLFFVGQFSCFLVSSVDESL